MAVIHPSVSFIFSFNFSSISVSFAELETYYEIARNQFHVIDLRFITLYKYVST
jgi:hypothetical protein